MTYHADAKLTLRQRHALVLEIEAGSTLRAAAAARNVAPATAHRVVGVLARRRPQGACLADVPDGSFQSPAAQPGDAVGHRAGPHLRGP
jgi:hypothetical protein